jgi:hypothetical protein
LAEKEIGTYREVNVSQPENKPAGHGLLMKWFEVITDMLVKLSLGKKFESSHADWLDIYIISWSAFEIAILVILVFFSLDRLATTVLFVLLSYHLFEIAVTSFNSVIILPLKRKQHRSVPRLFSLVLMNYLEVILIFGIIFNLLLGAEPFSKNLLYSVSLAVLNVPSFDQQSCAVITASIFELLFGCLFVVGVIGTLTNYIGSKE